MVNSINLVSTIPLKINNALTFPVTRTQEDEGSQYENKKHYAKTNVEVWSPVFIVIRAQCCSYKSRITRSVVLNCIHENVGSDFLTNKASHLHFYHYYRGFQLPGTCLQGMIHSRQN